jgi:hypothetical protein
LPGGTFDLLVTGPERVGVAKDIELFHDKEIALKTAELFARNFCDAVEHGYTFRNRYFTHTDGRTIDVSNALDIDPTQENFIELLSQGETKKDWMQGV